MQLFQTPNYSELFFGPKPTIEELLYDIPSKMVITWLAMINCELYLNESDKQTQIRVSNIVSMNFTSNHKIQLKSGLNSFFEKINNGQHVIFSKRYILEFYKYELINYREGDNLNTKPEQEFKLLKAYFLFNELINDKDKVEFEKNKPEIGDPYFFQKMVWPGFYSQIDINNHIFPGFPFIKVLALFKYFITQPELNPFLKEFLRKNGFNTLSSLLGSIKRLIDFATNEYPNEELRRFRFITSIEEAPHLDNLSISPLAFSKDQKKHIAYLGLREKPLFKIGDREYIILDINFLLNKIYNGSLFDLYRDTSISQVKKTFDIYKSDISKEVMEKIVFKGLLKYIFVIIKPLYILMMKQKAAYQIAILG